MSFAELLLLGVALSMDAFAVSVTNGMTFVRVPLRYALAVSLTFGTFQALMPLIGFFGGSFFYTYIEAIDHWVVLVLLCALGGKMIFEAVRELRAAERKNADCETLSPLRLMRPNTAIRCCRKPYKKLIILRRRRTKKIFDETLRVAVVYRRPCFWCRESRQASTRLPSV